MKLTDLEMIFRGDRFGQNIYALEAYKRNHITPLKHAL